MLERLPERVRSRPVAEAMFSASATLLAGAAVSAAVLTGAPIVVAAAAGVAAWAARVAFAIPRKPREMRVDPSKLSDPWRGFVVDAVDAKARFDQACRRTPPGPLRDRLNEVGRHLEGAVLETWRIARQGEMLHSAYSQLDVEDVEQELTSLEDDHPAVPSLKAQLQAAQRIGKVGKEAIERLRVLNARLDEAVARAIELSVSAMHEEDLLGVSNQVNSLVQEMESVRQALEETQGTPTTSAGGAA